ncbi:hypothetical protein GLOTRDRAFT_140973 [Gloeophyllum trabeum ATCC 11539]|uniref:Uncharacterized protein n=1 Tax=Gloeophyllum trabeum (strain ATCC 11539 / FP-39264 / Madison 617) TaxID=670483 RepID=S7RBH1_GLOTA|nr:uncharacterized protein GLOTRDRAFT_140973 [Gloeophyllum trabeum ATCC 11539]EPQ51580.1 hypothetical protein GLOTRDRAFT_140973 [Gloeophyllum trabeum ATCC 11539]
MAKRFASSASPDLVASKSPRMSFPSPESAFAGSSNPADGISDEMHASWDARVLQDRTIQLIWDQRQDVNQLPGLWMQLLLSYLVGKVASDLSEYQDTSSVVFAKYSEDPEIQRLAEAGLENRSFKDLRLKLREMSRSTDTDTSDLQRSDPEQVAATIASWGGQFKGQAASVLRQTIASFLHPGRMLYARYATIVNSSGTGKSRMVDELGKDVIVIYMCLRDHRSEGFPPADADLRDWLLKISKGDGRVDGFLWGLLTVTSKCLEDIVDREDLGNLRGEPRLRRLASAFRSCMVDGQTFNSVNDYRKSFYSDVIKEATDFANASVPMLNGAGQGSPRRGATLNDEGQTSTKAAHRLLEVVSGEKLPLSKLPRGLVKPYVVLSFDEAYDLPQTPPKHSWSIFSEIRCALRSLEGLPIFSLFLSTLGRFQDFSPDSYQHRSAQVVLEAPDYKVLPAITEIVFDELAPQIVEGEYTLEKVTKIDFMCRLGRPLFGSRYDFGSAKVKDELLDFARAKLLGTSVSATRDSDKGLLACLALRYAFEFRPKNPREREVESEQVERHMRICLAATPGFQSMVTVAPSEPLLAEAAGQELKDRSEAQLMSEHLDVWGVHRGDRGELAAMLLLMKARDMLAYGPRNHSPVFSVLEFLQTLLHESANIGDALPSTSRQDECLDFSTTFKDARMAFNHFVKVQDYDVINVQYLWRLVLRRAAILCADNHRGVDIVIPFVFKDAPIEAQNISAILIQVKNDRSYSHKVQRTTFVGMDPRRVRLFTRKDSPLPVIRMVFSLGSWKAGLTVVQPPERRSSRIPSSRPFTAYDIWCAQISSDTFGVINSEKGEDVRAYESLLRRSLGVHDGFELRDDPKAEPAVREARINLRRRMYPGAAALPSHFNSFIDWSKSMSQVEQDHSDEDEKLPAR